MFEEMKANDATRYVVIGGASVQSTHSSEGDAKQSAEAKAAANDGSEYAVYQKIGSAKLEPKVVWKGAAR